VLEMAGELDPFELKAACEMKDFKLVSIVGKALDDSGNKQSSTHKSTVTYY